MRAALRARAYARFFSGPYSPKICLVVGVCHNEKYYSKKTNESSSSRRRCSSPIDRKKPDEHLQRSCQIYIQFTKKPISPLLRGNMRRLLFFFLAFFACSATSFAPYPHLPTKTLARWSAPSDTPSDASSEDNFFTVEIEDFEPTAAEAAVTSLLDLVPSAIGEISDSNRAAINEVILKLEALNPTEQPAKSSLVNGVWELRYAAGYTSDWALASPTRQLALFLYSGGYSPGLFAISLANQLPSSLVEIRDLEISISREQPRVQATVGVKSAFGNSSVKVKSKLEVESDLRLRETYESTSVMGRSVEFPDMLRYSRSIYVTYVDQDILIIRDGSGVPELLVRKEKDFSKNWGTEPSEIDDM